MIDSRPKEDRVVSPLKKEVVSSNHTTPVKGGSAIKQASLFNFIKKREEKQIAKVVSQNSTKVIDSAEKFNAYKTWFNEHEVSKGSPKKTEAGKAKTVTAERTKPAEKTKPTESAKPAEKSKSVEKAKPAEKSKPAPKKKGK
jgi:hypothetical protein